MLNFAPSLIPKWDKNVPSIYPALKKAPIVIRNDSLTPEDPKAKNRLWISYMYNDF